MTRTLVIALAAIATFACVDDSDTRPPQTIDDNTVVLADSQFTPADLTVETGTEISWIWDDGSVSHNVVGEDFTSNIQTEGTFTHTFTQAGTHGYVCTLHPGMEGTVTVVESSS